MNFVNKIYELAEQIDYHHKMLNHRAAWLLLSTVAVWSLSDNHPIPAIVASILIMGFYAVIITNDLKAKYGDKLIADGWKIHIKKAIEMLEAEILEGCEESEQQKLLDLLEEKCHSRIKFKNFLKHRPFLIAYVFWAWMFYENLIAFLRYIK
ncbi:MULTISPECIES: hypothetical protein [Neisseria]|jgi:hypothetical protein|uniref:hypothetical protein n=1 Tax=Neisseria TaxID=482 RepID=UPI0012B79662|nr:MULTISPECIES: hypothetical protein [Neisseria]